jgi:hypothetical protein
VAFGGIRWHCDYRQMKRIIAVAVAVAVVGPPVRSRPRRLLISATSRSLHSYRALLIVNPIGRPPCTLEITRDSPARHRLRRHNYDRSVDPACTFCVPFQSPYSRQSLPHFLLLSDPFFPPSMSIHHAHNLPPSPSSEGQASQPPPTPTTASQATQAAPAKRSSRRANTAERRATHNAVERARRETLNGRFLVSVFLP